MDKIKELKLERMKLITECDNRYDPQVLKKERELLKQIEKLNKERA